MVELAGTIPNTSDNGLRVRPGILGNLKNEFSPATRPLFVTVNVR